MSGDSAAVSRTAPLRAPPAYRADGIVYRTATRDDDPDLRAMLCIAMESWVSMSLEREPSYFDWAGAFGESTTVIARADSAQGSPVGMYSCDMLAVHVNGRPERVGYLGALRVNAPYRNRLRVLRSGFESIRRLIPDRGTRPFWFTGVATENTVARRVLEAGLEGMPAYRTVGELETLAVSVQRARRSGLLRPARPEDLPGLVAFFNRESARYQFSPVLASDRLLSPRATHSLSVGDFRLLMDGARIRGCLALWDQRGVKQTIARSYRSPLGLLRRPYNLWARATKRVVLPAPGERLEHVFVAFMAFDARAESVAVDAIREALAGVMEKGAKVGVLGVSTANPLAQRLRGALSPATYRTTIQTVAWPEDGLPALDGRAPQPEVAIL
jgi:hypothetical protein